MRSPSVKPKVDLDSRVEFDFFKAVREMLNSSLLTRKAWNDDNLFMFLDGSSGILKLSNHGNITDLVLHKNDFEATDWVVLRQEIISS